MIMKLNYEFIIVFTGNESLSADFNNLSMFISGRNNLKTFSSFESL